MSATQCDMRSFVQHFVQTEMPLPAEVHPFVRGMLRRCVEELNAIVDDPSMVVMAYAGMDCIRGILAREEDYKAQLKYGEPELKASV
jgi:hypothetical protein